MKAAAPFTKAIYKGPGLFEVYLHIKGAVPFIKVLDL
jgi:hypothetical protein